MGKQDLIEGKEAEEGRKRTGAKKSEELDVRDFLDAMSG